MKNQYIFIIWLVFYTVAITLCGCQEEPTRENLVAQVRYLSAQNNHLSEQLAEANEKAEEAMNYADEAAHAITHDDVKLAHEAILSSQGAAENAVHASQPDD